MADEDYAERTSPSWPTPGFYFTVVFDVSSGITDTSFQEVTGLTAELNVEEVVEGGQNRFSYRLPTQMRYPNVVLKRAITSSDSALMDWCKSTLEDGLVNPIKMYSLNIQLLDYTGAPLREWVVTNAYPVKWEVAGFNSQRNEVAIETIELACNYTTRTQ